MTRSLLLLSCWCALPALADDFTVDSRETDGAMEITVVTYSSASPEALLAAVWTFDPRGTEGRMVRQRWVMEESSKERLVFSLLDTPVIGRRASRVRWSQRRDERGASVRFQTEDGPAPESEDAVRIQSRGEWRFIADGPGRTRVEHHQLSNPRTSIPVWMMQGPQRTIVVDLVKDVVARASGR